MEKIVPNESENGSFEVIEKYLRNELPEGERLAFEQKMAADAQLRQQVELHGSAIRAVRQRGRELLKAQFQEKDKAWLVNNQKAVQHRQKLKWLQLGFVLVALLGAFWWWRQGKEAPEQVQAPPVQSRQDTLEKKSQEQPAILPPPVATEEKKPPVQENPKKQTPAPPDARQLFADNFQPFKDEDTMNPNSSVRASGDKLTALDSFQQAYWEDRHQDALATFEALSPALKNNDNYLFVKANSLLATGKAGEAAGILEKIIANGRSRYKGEAKWYLSLAYLKNGKDEKAVLLLKEIAGDKKSARQEAAEKLLEKVR